MIEIPGLQYTASKTAAMAMAVTACNKQDLQGDADGQQRSGGCWCRKERDSEEQYRVMEGVLYHIISYHIII